ncbi:glutamyl aminopeptidase-like isoform X2 [Portunus trituberculatus]|nr:glutamyl aminopeptidase-like isoform X2 [Portunus trituberculatus]XP_045115493.1 glutamyl aminopeptidase-like isoform X2 [Portunus trituberculatus]
MVRSIDRPWEESFRLPETVIPEHYELYMHPDLSVKTFSGRVTISLTSQEPRDHFLVHSQWLTITNTSLVSKKGSQSQDVHIIEAFSYEPHQFWVVRMDQVEAGSFELTLHFSGSLVNGILGYYYSDYTDGNGKLRGMATTKFQPTYARRAFPCLDEPGFKSTYSLTLVRPSQEYRALSNMPVKKETQDSPSSGLTEVAFEKSVPMVTYLVCFIVCDFTFKEVILESGMPFRVYARENHLSDTNYALEVGKSVLQMYEGMFDLPFPLPKSDMVGIPDYSSGATEHWGIITFRETAIYYNDKDSSAANKQRVASVISHEMAHQWFGNLVTLKWWDDLWLNEGFASYVEYKGVAHVEPNWEMEFQFCTRTLLPVLGDDALVSSHPIIQTVETPDQINSIFDKIAYNKGASVLRMLEDFMGESFQIGINAFLKKFMYANAVTQDLWNELTRAWAGHVPVGAKSDVGAIMNTWTQQMGFPVVTVKRAAPDTLAFSQQRFLLDPNAQYNPDDSPFRYKWDVPVSYITSANSTIQRSWFNHEDSTLEVKVPAEVTWVKVNVHYKGFYRVNYEVDMWNELGKLCASQALSTADRAGLYSDVFALADAGLLSYTVPLDLSRNLASESDYVPWDAMTATFVGIQRLLASSDAYQSFKDYVSSLVEPLYCSLGWDGEGDHLRRLLRTDVVTLACISGSDTCLEAAARKIESWILDSNSPLPLDARRQSYRWGVVKEGGREMWEVMWQRALAETSATETDNLYFGMANFQDTSVLQSYIELSMKEENVRSQNFLSILEYISTNPVGNSLVWDWVRSHWEWLVERYTINDRYLGQLIPKICRYFATGQKLTEMEAFFSQYPEAGAGERYRQQAIETVKYNIRWVNDNAATILAWLQALPPSPGNH